jgi:hypothetical protein
VRHTDAIAAPDVAVFDLHRHQQAPWGGETNGVTSGDGTQEGERQVGHSKVGQPIRPRDTYRVGSYLDGAPRRGQESVHQDERTAARGDKDFFPAASVIECRTANVCMCMCMCICMYAHSKRCSLRAQSFFFMFLLTMMDLVFAATRESGAGPLQAKEGHLGLAITALRRGLLALDL